MIPVLLSTHNTRHLSWLMYRALCISYYFYQQMHNILTVIYFTKMTNNMHLCRIIYYSLAALHVSSDIFAHHQEHLNCIYSFWYYTRMLLSVGIVGELELTEERKYRSKHVE
jgi:hypothetical protein